MPCGIVGRMGPGMRQVVGFGDRSAGRGTFGGEFGARISAAFVTNGDFAAYVCDSAATRSSGQITLGRLVIIAYNIIGDSKHAVGLCVCIDTRSKQQEFRADHPR